MSQSNDPSAFVFFKLFCLRMFLYHFFLEKVLRLWLERKTLPEPIVRHHIREIESVNGTSLTSSYSRRPSRTERSLNDPIREMEGMFVDEYGRCVSNLSFYAVSCLLCQLHGK